MNEIDFKDPVVERKLTFQIARKGCGIHRDRYLCYFSLEGAESTGEEATQFLIDLAKIHYEADFIVGTSADENSTVKEYADDNLYLLDNVSDEQDAFLKYKAQITVTEKDFNTVGYEALKERVVNALKRDSFKRDETTKVAIFKITPGPTGGIKSKI